MVAAPLSILFLLANLMQALYEAITFSQWLEMLKYTFYRTEAKLVYYI